MMFFDIVSPAELMAPASVPITALIPGDPQPGLVVPCYTFRDCPTAARFRLGAYMSNPPGDFFIATYANATLAASCFVRDTSLLTPLTGP